MNRSDHTSCRSFSRRMINKGAVFAVGRKDMNCRCSPSDPALSFVLPSPRTVTPSPGGHGHPRNAVRSTEDQLKVQPYFIADVTPLRDVFAYPHAVGNAAAVFFGTISAVRSLCPAGPIVRLYCCNRYGFALIRTLVTEGEIPLCG